MVSKRKKDNYTNFISQSRDPGIYYVESYFYRNIDNIRKGDLIAALKVAARTGNGKPDCDKIEFMRALFHGDLIFLTTREQKAEIFRIAAILEDQESEQEIQTHLKDFLGLKTQSDTDQDETY